MSTNKILRWTLLSAIFLLPFICLIVAYWSFFPFITGKNFAFRILVEIIVALWLALALRDHTALPKPTRLLQVFGIFIVTIFISDLLSPNSFKSFWSNYERMEGWVTLVHLFGLFVVMSSVMTKDAWKWLLRVSVGVSLIAAGYGALQLAGKLAIHQGGVRLDATFGNATYLAVYLLFHIFFNLILITWEEKKSYWNWAYGFAILAELYILYHTATRGAILGLIGGLFITAVLVLILNRENKLVKQTAIGIVVAIPILAGAFMSVKNTDFVVKNPVLTRFASLSLTDKTTESRFMIWSMAYKGFKEKPIFGWGQESFNYVFNKYYEPKMYSNEQWFDRTHNVFFDWLIAGGILGVLSYFGLFGLALYYLWRKGNHFTVLEKSLMTGLLAGYLFHNLTVFDNITSYILFVFVLAWINSRVGEHSTILKNQIEKIDLSTRNQIIIPIIVVVFVFGIYYVNVPSILASDELVQAISPQAKGPSENIAHYEKVFALKGLGDSEAREQLVQAASMAASQQGVDVKVKQDFFELAKKQMVIQLDRTPNDARYFLFGGSLLSSYGDYDNAIKVFERAVELSPNKQTIMFSLGSVYFGKKDYKTAISVMKKAYDLDPSFGEARKMYALALIYDKQIDLATELLKPLSQEELKTDQRFISAYFNSGYFEKAIEGINMLINQSPDNFQLYVARASMEVARGRINSAIADLRKVAELNPAAKAEVDQLIAQVRAGKGF